MKKTAIFCAAVWAVLAVNGLINAATVTFTAADIVSAIGGLSNTTYQWGLWGIRARPVVTGGSFTLTEGGTSQAGYNVDFTPGNWPVYGTKYVYYNDILGTNPRYLVIDRPANTFTSDPGEIVTKVADSASFSFSFDLDIGAVWAGQCQFLVDGAKYTLGTVEHPGTFVEEFYGGYASGGLAGNTGQGYTIAVPEPAVIFMLGQGLLIFSICTRRG